MVANETIEALAALLDLETQALMAGDYSAARLTVGQKLELGAAIAAISGDPAIDAASVAAPLGRLREAAEANRAALERAMAVQRDLVQLIAQTVHVSQGTTTSYGRPDPIGAPPLALSLRA
jgi:hypothetical protein